MRPHIHVDIDHHTCWQCQGYAGHLRAMVGPDPDDPGRRLYTRACYRCERELVAKGWTREPRKAGVA